MHSSDARCNSIFCNYFSFFFILLWLLFRFWQNDCCWPGIPFFFCDGSGWRVKPLLSSHKGEKKECVGGNWFCYGISTIPFTCVPSVWKSFIPSFLLREGVREIPPNSFAVSWMGEQRDGDPHGTRYIYIYMKVKLTRDWTWVSLSPLLSL